MESEGTQQINSLGVGSFVFKVCSDEVQKTETHISSFRTELLEIPGVKNVFIKPDPLVHKHITPHGGEVSLSFLDLEFDIDLSAGDFSIEHENKFKFVSRAQYDSVVTTIFPYFKTENPSMGIMRVREHIKSFLNDPYNLEIVGPSPFHADFFIYKTNFFGIDITKNRGYDHIQIHVKSNNDSNVIDEIYQELAGELNLFYLVRNTEVARSESWLEVEELISKVLEKPRFLSTSIDEQFSFRHNYLDKAMQLLAEFEADSLGFGQLINERFDNTYSTGKSFLVSYVETERNEVYEYPVESTQNLLKFIADSRGRAQETINTYVNTIVNVILGFGVAIALYILRIK